MRTVLPMTVVRPVVSLGQSAVMVLVRAGSLHDPAGQTGIAHFIEHMMFRDGGGSGEHRLLQAFRLVGTMNAWTDSDHTLYYIQVPDGHAVEAIGLLVGMAFRARLPLSQADLRAERKVVLEEYKALVAQPETAMLWKLQQHVFEGHPMSRTGISDRFEYGRSEIQEFVARHYRPENSHLVVCTSLPGTVVRQAAALAVRRVGVRVRVRAPVVPVPVPVPVPGFVCASGKLPRRYEIPGRKGQGGVAIGFPVRRPRTLRDSLALDMVAFIAGGCSPVNELFRVLRLENDLVYGADSTVSGVSDGWCMFTAHCLVDSHNADADRAEKIMTSVLKSTPQKEQFDVYKEHMLNSIRCSIAASAQDYSQFQVTQLMRAGTAVPHGTLFETLESLSYLDVEKAARGALVFDSRCVVVRMNA